MIVNSESRFLEQAPNFLAQAFTTLGVSSFDDLPAMSEELPTPLAPVVIRDFQRVTLQEKSDLASSFFGRHGVAAFALANPTIAREHPLLSVSNQLGDTLPLKYPISHPAESEQRAQSRFGKSDGTLKVFQRSDQDNSLQSKELHLHQDGIGLAGTVVAIGLYCESGPLWGGLTCFQNALRLVVELARIDEPAFQALFLPEAVTIIRKKGRKALKVTGPVLYLNALGQPQVFLRAAGGEYEMIWSREEPISRAREFLKEYLKPFALASSFAQLSVEGQGCFIRNTVVLHGRTKFLDDTLRKRVLARKWFGLTAHDAFMKQVPGMRIWDTFSALRPDLFGADVLCGHWRYDESSGQNIPIDNPND